MELIKIGNRKVTVDIDFYDIVKSDGQRACIYGYKATNNDSIGYGNTKEKAIKDLLDIV